MRHGVLHEKHIRAAEQVARGRQYTDIAKEIDVPYYTLYHWIKHNPLFKQCVEEKRQEIRQRAEDSLGDLLDLCNATVRDLLLDIDPNIRLKTVAMVYDKLNLGKPSQPTDSDDWQETLKKDCYLKAVKENPTASHRAHAEIADNYYRQAIEKVYAEFTT